jgi:alkylhydroperoxidase family enzyme
MHSVLDELEQLLRHVSSAAGTTTPAERGAAASWASSDAALTDYLRAVESSAWAITDEQVAALRARFSDDQLFELTVAAALASGVRRMRRGLEAMQCA